MPLLTDTRRVRRASGFVLVAVSYICHDGVASARSESRAIRRKLVEHPGPRLGLFCFPIPAPCVMRPASALNVVAM
jgi:hypothetical protein